MTLEVSCRYWFNFNSGRFKFSGSETMRIAVFLILFGFANHLTVLVAQDKVKKNNQIAKDDAFDGWINLFHGNPRFGF